MKGKKKAKPEPKADNEVAPLPKRHLSPEALADAILQFKGNLAACGRHFGVTRTAVWNYVEARPELKEAVRDARETRVDNAESSLDRAVLAGEGWAVTLILKTLGKDRGYSERHEHEHSGPGGGPIPVANLSDDELRRRIADLESRVVPPGTGDPAGGVGPA